MQNKDNPRGKNDPSPPEKKDNRSDSQRFLSALGNFALWFLIGYLVVKLLTGQ